MSSGHRNRRFFGQKRVGNNAFVVQQARKRKVVQSRPIQMRIYHSNERCRISDILRHRGKLFQQKIPYFSSK